MSSLSVFSLVAAIWFATTAYYRFTVGGPKGGASNSNMPIIILVTLTISVMIAADNEREWAVIAGFFIGAPMGLLAWPAIEAVASAAGVGGMILLFYIWPWIQAQLERTKRP